MDRSVQLAADALHQAWRDAGFEHTRPDSHRLGLVAGTSRGPAEKWIESTRRLDKSSMLPSLAASTTTASLSGALAQLIRATGPCFTVSSACASSATAIVNGALLLLSGAADVVIAGGAEAPLNPVVLRQLHAAGVLGQSAQAGDSCRPFDLRRNGTVLGEGAAFLVLERAGCARQRGAHIHAFLGGWALGMDSAGRTGIHESGDAIFETMRGALSMAELSPQAVGYLNAHGTGTRLNDRIEAGAIHRLFGAAGVPAPCSSTKATTGHCMGAAAAIEAVACILALQRQFLPLSANCHEPDPDCPINLVRHASPPLPLRAVMSNSAGFWGHNASLLFVHPDGEG